MTKMTKNKNAIEDSLNKIRVSLYESEKNLSIEESVKRGKEHNKECSEKYGYKIAN